MKNSLCLLIAFVFCVTARAQSTVSEWQAKAVEQYPALGIEGSAFNKAFVAEYERRQRTNPESLRAHDWPMLIAVAVDAKLRDSSSTGGANPLIRAATSTPAPNAVEFLDSPSTGTKPPLDPSDFEIVPPKSKSST